MIRPFSPSDLDSILQIESLSFPKSAYDWMTFLNLHALYPETFLVSINPSTPHPEERGVDAIEQVHVNRSRKREEMEGYIIFTQKGHIISMAVHPRVRRKGIGTKLLQRVMKSLPHQKVWAEVRRSNQGAQAFYFKMGFQMAGMIPNYYGNEDALIIQWAPVIRDIS